MQINITLYVQGRKYKENDSKSFHDLVGQRPVQIRFN